MRGEYALHKMTKLNKDKAREEKIQATNETYISTAHYQQTMMQNCYNERYECWFIWIIEKCWTICKVKENPQLKISSENYPTINHLYSEEFNLKVREGLRRSQSLEKSFKFLIEEND